MDKDTIVLTFLIIFALGFSYIYQALEVGIILSSIFLLAKLHDLIQSKPKEPTKSSKSSQEPTLNPQQDQRPLTQSGVRGDISNKENK